MDIESDSSDVDLSDLYEKSNFHMKNGCTYYRPLTKKQNKSVLFFEAVLQIYASYCDRTGSSNGWIVQCKARNNRNVIVLKKFVLTYNCFSNVQLFEKEVYEKFGNHIMINASVKNVDLKRYHAYLKKQYMEGKEKKELKKITHIGYMGQDYWFLSQNFQLKGTKKLGEEDQIYFSEDKELDLQINFPASLLVKENCICINKRIVEKLTSFKNNAVSLEFIFGFVLSRLLQSSRNTDNNSCDGETNILLILGEKNVGKSLAQLLVHYGQGPSNQSHPLLLSGGNSVTSGTSISSIQEVAKKTTMLLNLNDVVNNKLQAESFVQIHEQLQQGSSKTGMWRSLVSGVIVSSNEKETDRIDGRVIRVKFEKTSFSEEMQKQIQDLKKNCENNHGFLLSWVLNFKQIWNLNVEQATSTICAVLAEYLPNTQQRWCSGVALAIYTGYLYRSTLGLECSIGEELKRIISLYKEDAKADFMYKLEKNIHSKISKNSAQVLEWLNWTGTVSWKGGKDTALGVKTEIFKDCFIDIERKEIVQYLSDLEVEQAVGVTLYFASNPQCTINDIHARKNSGGKRAHKFPLPLFSQELQDWITNENLEAPLPPFKRSQNVTMHDESSIDVAHLERAVDEKLREVNERGDMDGGSTSHLMQTPKTQSEEFNWISPTTRTEVTEMTPKSQECFLKAVRYTKRKLLLEDGDCSVAGCSAGSSISKEKEATVMLKIFPEKEKTGFFSKMCSNFYCLYVFSLRSSRLLLHANM